MWVYNKMLSCPSTIDYFKKLNVNAIIYLVLCTLYVPTHGGAEFIILLLYFYVMSEDQTNIYSLSPFSWNYETIKFQLIMRH